MSNKKLIEKKLYTVKELEEFFNIPSNNTYKKIGEGSVKFIRLGKKYLILSSEIKNILCQS